MTFSTKFTFSWDSSSETFQVCLSCRTISVCLSRKMPKSLKKKIRSTPFTRIHNVRESLGIKKNTVSGMVKLFTERSESIEFDSKVASSSPPITGQGSYVALNSDLTPIKETSSYISIDSGYDSVSFRGRSKNFGARSIRDSVIDSYAKYPNFKWSYLKYFGEDPKEYLSRYDIDLDTIDKNSTVSQKITANLGRDDNDELFRSMRERSQTFSAKRPGEKLESQGLIKKRRREIIRSDVTTLIMLKAGMFSLFGSRLSILVSTFGEFIFFVFIDSTKEKPTVRGLNEKPTPNIADLKLTISGSIKAFGTKYSERFY